MSRIFKNIIILLILALFLNIELTAQNAIINKLPFNSSAKNDFAPFVVDSTIYFSSDRKNELLKSYLDQNNNWLHRIYQVQIVSKNNFSKPILFSATEDYKLNTGSIWISPGEKRAFVTQNQAPKTNKKKQQKNLLGIFSIDKSYGSNWQTPTPFPYNSLNEHSTAHPTFSSDGKTMFFVSNQNDSYGESDIYQSDFENGQWSEPINLGSNINTSGKEIFPYYHPSGKLYFSSNGRSESNDFDIFVSTFENNEWGKAKALEEPINSKYNDFSCFIFESELEGYFASNREGVDNIYHFRIPFPSFPNAQEEVEDIFCFTLFENGPYQSDTLPYKYKWLFNDGITKMGTEVDHCFPGEGEYSVNLSVYDTLQKVDLFTVATYDLPLENTQQIKIECSDTVKVNEPMNISAKNSELKGFIPEDYYWILDHNKKTKGITINHIFRKSGTYTIVCGAPSIHNPQHKLATKKTIIVIE
ncbi:PKD domain-containing protein [Saccharicrinis aurantiacus]|uniref:PKD domain-containing protein n=1 Tax=Saccharicrinis aurantiacus TaxID=1849719 RepID=UPI000837D42F|nr:PKD domain-containing protein [Saccharicrinis aurantiacus]